MFQRLKNWILNRPAEDHAVASFAWFGGAYLALGTALAFPILTPVAAGAAVIATHMGILEGIMTGAHVIGDILSWGLGKILKPKAQSVPVVEVNDKSNSNQEKSNDKGKQQQNSEEDLCEKVPQKEAQPAQKPVIQPPVQGMPPKSQGADTPQVIQVPSSQLMALIQQMQVLSLQVKQMQREILALRLENQKLKQRNNPENNRTGRRPVPRKNIITHRHYIQNGRMMHE